MKADRPSDFWESIACRHLDIGDPNEFGEAVCPGCGRTIVTKLTESGFNAGIKRIAREQGVELHPEDCCRRCGGPNVNWHAPSPLWNAVMRGGSIDGPWEFGELICPTCFCVLAEERGVADSFAIVSRNTLVPLETTTPSGRTWDDERQLWIEPSPPAVPPSV